MTQLRFVDSHCHLDFDDYGGDIEPVINFARSKGIQTLLNICTKHDEIDQVIQTAQQHPSVYATVGIHPHEAGPTLEQYPPNQLFTWLCEKAQHPKVVGVGETGLDYYYENSPRQTQREAFEVHIKAAQTLSLPLSIHTRAAEKDTIQLLEQKNVTGVIHCFSESQWLCDAALSLGLYISLSGIITFKKADELRAVVKTIPLDRLLLETDAPFLAPIPYRGKRNEPGYLIETAKVLAELKGISLEDLAEATTQNFFSLFSKVKG